MNVLLDWWKAATPEEKRALAEHCRTTVETLRQEAHAYRNKGGLQVTLSRAAYIESGTRRLQREGLPALDKGALCPLWIEIDALQK